MKNRCMLFLLLTLAILSITGCGMVSQEEYESLEEKCLEYEEIIRGYESRDWYEDGKSIIFQDREEYKEEMKINYELVTTYVEENIESAEQQEILQRIDELYEFYYVDDMSEILLETLEKVDKVFTEEDDIYEEKLKTLFYFKENIEITKWAFHVHITEICPEYEWFYK